ncbi:MAG: ATP-binding cassette domain-containing protein [Flavobacteriaceae bacterium]|nr:ATP-binding cassette domain-containing protein [Flavobacteriaceae bacterium]
MSIILQVEKLNKKFGKIHAVQDLSFSIKKGNIYGILGPNGSGKSTTLGMILNVVNPTSGSYRWFDGSSDTHQALKRIGAIIERPNFYPYMSAHQNLKIVCLIKEINPNVIDEKLEMVGLLDRKNDRFKTFSLGMKQRLAIASALLNNPEILILDEPTNGLDPQGIFQIREIIQKVATQGTTILLASHLLDEVEKVCTHVIVLQEGVSRYSGSVEALTASHGYFELSSSDQNQLIELLKNHPDISEIKHKKELVIAYLSKDVTAEMMSRYLIEHHCIPTHLIKKHERLETQFLALTKNPKA